MTVITWEKAFSSEETTSRPVSGLDEFISEEDIREVTRKVVDAITVGNIND